MAHMHYKGTGKVHSFRGLLANGDQRKIRIQGSVGEIAWRITKFELMTQSPGIGSEAEHVVKIYKDEQDSITGTINFVDNALLGAAFLPVKTSLFAQQLIVTFDNEIFSRNIYVTHTDNGGNAVDCNYYIELEEVKVSAAGMAQLAVAAARRTID